MEWGYRVGVYFLILVKKGWVDHWKGSVTEGLIEKIKKSLSEIEKMVSISENLNLAFLTGIDESEKLKVIEIEKVIEKSKSWSEGDGDHKKY